MKKLILTSLFVIAATVVGFCQFSDRGYKDLKLGMSLKDAKKITNISLDKNGSDTIRYDGLVMKVQFYDMENGLELFSITSSSPKAKIKNVLSDLIGKSLKEVKAILGSKLVAAEMGEERQTTYFIYYVDKKAEKNYTTSCLLTFSDKGILKSIGAVHNP